MHKHDIETLRTQDGRRMDSISEYALTGAPPDGDSECDQNYVSHEVANSSTSNFIRFRRRHSGTGGTWL